MINLKGPTLIAAAIAGQKAKIDEYLVELRRLRDGVPAAAPEAAPNESPAPKARKKRRKGQAPAWLSSIGDGQMVGIPILLAPTGLIIPMFSSRRLGP